MAVIGREVTEVVVVHDATCGTCARIARDLPAVLRVPVRLRSCRDPQVEAAYPGVPAATRACRVPAVGTVAAGGSVRWRPGLLAAPALLRLVRPRALPRAFALLASALLARRATVQRTPRVPGADHR